MARQMGMAIKGTFTCVKGELTIDPEALERSTAVVVIDATSLETALPAFAAILEAKDFLDLEHHPTIEFRSGAISRSGDRHLIAGELLFRGESREVTVEAGPPEFLTDESSADQADAAAPPNRVRIRGSAALKGLVADEDLEVTIELEAVPAAAGVTADLAAGEKAAAQTLEHTAVTTPAAAAPADAADGAQAARTESGAPREPDPEGVITVESGVDEKRPVKILGLAGSYREGSHNQALLRAAMEEAPPGVVIEPFDLRDLPFFDADLEAAGDPPPVRRLKEAIAAADGLLIATPEYNRGLPADARTRSTGRRVQRSRRRWPANRLRSWAPARGAPARPRPCSTPVRPSSMPGRGSSPRRSPCHAPTRSSTRMATSSMRQRAGRSPALSGSLSRRPCLPRNARPDQPHGLPVPASHRKEQTS